MTLNDSESAIKRAPLEGVDNIKRFIYAGQAVFTLETPDTSRTYKVRKLKGKSVWFYSVLIGPNNITDYMYFAWAKEPLGYIHAKPNRTNIDVRSVSATYFRYLLRALKGGTLPHGVNIWHEAYCAHCGRPLTVVESVESGLGPECLRRSTENN